MESFRYAATRDPRAKSHAKRAFEALRFLQTVTETPGFVARTVIPSDWKRMADPNITWTEQEWADNYVHNAREKRVEKRWRLSRDGKWLWKGDSSSDEITGHMFGYLFYYDLVAEQAERKVVAEHVANIVDYIIDGGLVMKDIDGKHTRWAVWPPEKLNHDNCIFSLYLIKSLAKFLALFKQKIILTFAALYSYSLSESAVNKKVFGKGRHSILRRLH